ncbi:MAG: L-rhamnose mutarotase [Flavobacteriaceae bacterium]|jgi:L-rhamnose mutarotase|nr:L-rhamnose mutarotase [Flavobacteriaceae bacterium]
MSRYCLALDLVDDPFLIDQYLEHHKKVWPEIIESIKDSGIESMEIYHVADRLFMIIETEKDFSFKKKSKMDAHNPYVIKWEELMSQYQKVLPVANAGEKWILMDKVFDLIETKQQT